MALIRLDVNANMDEVNSFLEKADAATVNLANHAVAKASKNTRSGARQIEGSLLDVGKGNRNTFNYKGKGGWRKRVTESHWDPQGKVFKTDNRMMGKKRRKVSNNPDKHYQLEYFKFTASANVNKGNFVASADTTSLLANLHDQSVSFPRGSVFFSNGTKWGRFRPGGTRSGKGIMTKFLARANSTFPQSEREAISYWEKEIKEAEKG